MKKIISIFLCLFLCITCYVPAISAEKDGLQNFTIETTYYDGQFYDVTSSDWFSDEVRIAFELGLVKGDSATSFNPNGNMKVCEAITLACRLHNIYYNYNFNFVQKTPWYQVYIDYALENGIITLNQFPDYNAFATRAEFVTILSSALPDKAFDQINNIKGIPDVDRYAPYADSVYKLYGAGILTGNDSFGTFAPYSTIRRCEVAAIVSRVALPNLRKEFIPANQSTSIVSDATVINLSAGHTFTITIYISIRNDNAIVNAEYDSEYIDLIWGEWDGYSIPLTIIARRDGSSQIKISLENDPNSTIYVDVHADAPSQINSYIGNTNPDSLKFHYDWCVSVKRMKESNKFYYTGTRDEMIAMGYIPCKNCNP